MLPERITNHDPMTISTARVRRPWRPPIDLDAEPSLPASRDTSWCSPCISRQNAAECGTRTAEQLRRLAAEGRCCVTDLSLVDAEDLSRIEGENQEIVR